MKCLQGFLLVFLFSLASSGLFAQLNFVVGINGAYVKGDGNNQLLKDFNSINAANLNVGFPEFNFISGLELGLRYSNDNAGVTLGYSFDRRSRDSEVFEDATTTVQRSVNYGFGTLYIGLEGGLRDFKIGTSLGSRITRLKSRFGSSNSFENVHSDRNWVSRFYIVLRAKGNRNSSLALRPYFDFAWDRTSLTRLNNNLTGRSTILSDRFHMIGLSILFYNGPQPN